MRLRECTMDGYLRGRPPIARSLLLRPKTPRVYRRSGKQLNRSVWHFHLRALTKEKNVANLDHVGVAVQSIAQARRLYETLGLAVLEEPEDDGVRSATVPLGESQLRLQEVGGAE